MRTLFIILFFLISICSIAQDETHLNKELEHYENLSALGNKILNNNPKDNQYPKLSVSISTLPLFGFFPTTQIGFEHRVYKKLSFGYEYGWVTPFQASNNFELDRRGNRFRFESKLYLNTNTFDFYYFSMQVFKNDLRYNEETVYGINCPDGTCDFFQFAKVTTVFKDFGLLARIGSILYLNQANTFFLDGSVGFGFRERNVSFINKPEGTSIISYQNGYLFQQSTENYQGLHINLSIKIAYRFK